MTLLDIDRAFIDEFLDRDFLHAEQIALPNLKFTPTHGTPFAELINLPNDASPLTIDGSSETDGIFRVLLNWPVDTGDIAAKMKAQEIISYYDIGKKIGEAVVTGHGFTAQSSPVGSWYLTVITISYRAFLTNEV